MISQGTLTNVYFYPQGYFVEIRATVNRSLAGDLFTNWVLAQNK